MLLVLDEIRNELGEIYGEQTIAYRTHGCSVTGMDEQQQPMNMRDEPF
jgi:hypothetical protein